MRKMKHLVVEGNEAATAELHASHWLARANELSESGQHTKAESFYDKAQFWLDRANKLEGNM